VPVLLTGLAAGKEGREERKGNDVRVAISDAWRGLDAFRRQKGKRIEKRERKVGGKKRSSLSSNRLFLRFLPLYPVKGEKERGKKEKRRGEGEKKAPAEPPLLRRLFIVPPDLAPKKE